MIWHLEAIWASQTKIWKCGMITDVLNFCCGFFLCDPPSKKFHVTMPKKKIICIIYCLFLCLFYQASRSLQQEYLGQDSLKEGDRTLKTGPLGSESVMQLRSQRFPLASGRNLNITVKVFWNLEMYGVNKRCSVVTLWIFILYFFRDWPYANSFKWQWKKKLK